MQQGDKINKLTFVQKIKIDCRGKTYAKFKCECGNQKVIRVDCVTTGNTKSCGCLYNSMEHIPRKHGMHNSRIYKIWAGMKRRCKDKQNKKAHLYSLKGIYYDERWESFDEFYNDMGDCPEGFSIERLDGSKGYFKENCKWASPKEQANNTIKNKIVTFDGKTMNVTQWAEFLNIKPNTLLYRLRRGWKVKDALYGKMRQMSQL